MSVFDCISISSTSETYSKEEVERHNREIDAWIIIQNKVYDITKFISQHPVRRRREKKKKILLNIMKLGRSFNFNKCWR